MAKIAIVLTQGFADWEYALIGGTGGPFFGLDVQYFTPEAGEITSQGGLTTIVKQGLDALLAWGADVVVVIGGTVWESAKAPDLAEHLRQLHGIGTHIAGICGGTLALARAGLLDGVPHTSNEGAFLKKNAANYEGEPYYRTSASAVSSSRLITASGTAPASFTAAVFTAAGMPPDVVSQFKDMMAAEHR